MTEEQRRIPELMARRLPEGAVAFLGEKVALQELADAWLRCGRGNVARGNLMALLLAHLQAAGVRDRTARSSALQQMTRSTSIEDADLSRLRLEMLDLRGWTLRGCDLTGSAFVLCDVRGLRIENGVENAPRFEECIHDQPQLMEKRARVIETLRSQVGIFEIDDAKHLWRDKISQTDAERMGRYNPDAMAGLHRRGLVRREQGERGAWFIRLVEADLLRKFWRDGEARPPIDEVVDTLVRRSRI